MNFIIEEQQHNYREKCQKTSNFAANLLLTDKEKKLLEYRDDGMSYTDLAEFIGLTPSKVRYRFREIRKKTNLFFRHIKGLETVIKGKVMVLPEASYNRLIELANLGLELIKLGNLVNKDNKEEIEKNLFI